MATAELPSYMRAKRLRTGGVAYYWEPPSWARKRGCALRSEALGGDLAEALRKAAICNAEFTRWRKGDDSGTTAPGTVDWLVEWFEEHPRFLRTAAKTRRNYSAGLKLLAGVKIRERRFGSYLAEAVEPHHADALYERLQWVDERDAEGRPVRRRRLRTANEAMKAARRMWFLAQRAKLVSALANPFAKMELEGTGGNTVAPSRDQVRAFVAKADELGHPSMATAAVLAFELCQRETDVRCTIAWADYQAGVSIRVRQSKTGELVTLPLYDRAGALFPDVEARLAATPRRGPLVVMRDAPDRKRREWLPYAESWFQHLFREIAEAAGQPRSFTFRSLRHGGLTELGDAEASDQGIMAHSGHRTRQMLGLYVKRTSQQAAIAARRRLAWRTEQAELSERSGDGVSECEAEPLSKAPQVAEVK